MIKNTIRLMHDCEIKSISFAIGEATIRLFDPEEFTYFTLLFEGVQYFLFETDHTQNVIEGMIEFDTLQEMRGDPLAAAFAAKLPKDIKHAGAPERLIYIQPITGGEGVIVFRSVRVN